jgi:transglutaminase-like putative cysteine protease
VTRIPLVRLVDAVFVVALLAVAATPLWPVYRSPALIAVAVGALVVGGAIAAAGALRRLPAYAVAALTALGFVLFGVPLAVPSQAATRILPTAEGLRSLVLGAATSWKQMLSVDLPLGDYEALLVPAWIVLLVAVVVGLSLALRLRSRGWAVLAPVGVLAFAIAFGARTGQRPVATGVVFGIVALGWAVWTAARAGRGAGRGAGAARPIAAVVLVAVCLGAGGALVARATPSRDVLRTAVQPPFDPHHYVSPLSAYRNSVLAPAKTETMLTVTGLPVGGRIRVATLDDYDGRVFALGTSPSSGSFARVASIVDQTGVAGREATVGVTVGDYSDVWLPTVGALTSISFEGSDSASLRDSFFYDRDASSAAVLGGVSRGDRYTVDAVVPTATSAAVLAAATPGDAEQPKAEHVPAALIAAAKKHYGSASTPGARLAAVADWLRSGYVSDSGPGQPFSASGHSAGRLTSLVTANPMLGDAEQYAPALALVARSLGFPSRVVLGYAPTSSEAKKGTVALTGSDLTAWVEVESANGQWLTVDPNPKVRPVPESSKTQSQSVAQPQTVLPPPPPVQHDTAVTQNRDAQKTKHDPGLPVWLRIVLAGLRVAGIVLVIAAIVLAPLWAIALARWIRRRQRRRRDRESSVVTGAWSELLDDVRDRGFTVPRAATRSEVATLIGTPAVAILAERAERSVFSSQRLDPGDVDDYWRLSREASRGLADGQPRWPRFRYHLSARSLAWQRQHGQQRRKRTK